MIKTRIAPSPTGLFHIGTARTALINFIFAKQNNGEFLLRMEDTDHARNQPKFEEDIKSGLKWLGLTWDGEIVYQKNRTDRYLEIVEELLKNGRVYRKEGAVWFKIPDRKIKFSDLIRGEIEFDSQDLKDFVILRSNGSPIFYLSGVVDDHDFEITHIIRGEEHLSNTPKQILILDALGWSQPTYAHVPLILNTDRSKMSKRKDPVSISKDFEEQGYLPEAMINYLALLGWHEREKFQIPNPTRLAYGKPRRKSEITAMAGSRWGGTNSKLQIQKSKQYDEIYSIDELLEKFDISRMQKGGAVFDIDKLNNINHHYIQSKTDQEYLSEIAKFQPKGSEFGQFEKLALINRERIKKYSDITANSSWISQLTDYKSDLLIYKKSTKETTRKALNLVLSNLPKIVTYLPARASQWQAGEVTNIGEVLQKIVKDNDLQNGDVFWSTRVALSGLEKSPPPAEMMWVLGKEESISRITKAVEALNTKS